MVFVFITAKQKSGCLNSYKIENLFLEAAAGWHQQAVCPNQHFCLQRGYSEQGGVFPTELLFPRKSFKSTCLMALATSSLTALLWVWVFGGRRDHAEAPYEERSKSEIELTDTH